MMQHFGECLLLRYSPDHITPEVEKQTLLQMLLSTLGGREGAIQYLEHVK